jgi:hypothetical protein
MMEEHNLFPDTPFSLIDTHVLLASSVGQAVEAEKVAIFGLDDMLFSFVPEQGTDIYEVRCLRNGCGDPFFFTALAFILGGYE